MSAPKTILVPTDFSDAAESALDVALQLAATLRAKVYVMHAYQLPIVGLPDGVLLPTAAMASDSSTWAQRQLDACVAKRAESSVEIEAILAQAEPRAAVREVAEEVSADLVIMGTHGRRGLVRAVMGSVAEGVLRTSVRPVMTVHADSLGRTAARSAIKHILVPTDLSETSERALDVAIDLARAIDARITLLHVWSVPSYGYVDEVTWPRAG